jgi:KaiC/GvpD/RAD55 family RecA-like ATPase
MSMLKGKKPELVVPSKPKFMLSGDPGTGKTMFALNWDAPFYIDTERGATRKQYTTKLIAAGGAYFGPEDGSQDFREVINQVRELATTPHKYRCLVIDSFSKLYNLEAASAEERVGADFGKDKREANRPARQLMRWIERLDMSVILVCHSKEKWIRQERELLMVGKTYDGPPKLSFDLDLWMETKMAQGKWYATIVKSRIEGFVVGQDMPLDVGTFKKIYGESVVDGPMKPIVLATAEQVAEIKRIVELLKMSEEDCDKILSKAQAVEWEDMAQDNAVKLLDFLNKKLKGESK